MKQPETYGELFKPRPKKWGLRGDPYLWDALMEILEESPLPESFSEFASAIEGTFEYCTGAKISNRGFLFVEQFAHGGMSSGGISMEFWQRVAMPLLLKRFSQRFPSEN